MNTSPAFQLHASRLLALLLPILFALPMQAGNSLAGEITCTHVSGLTYAIELATYNDPSRDGVDPCVADIEVWAAGVPLSLFTVREDIPRANGERLQGAIPSDCTIPFPRNGEAFYGTIKYNVFRDTITFSAPGGYFLRHYDHWRSVSPAIPNPEALTFFLETYLLAIDPAAGQPNSHPGFLNAPLDLACLDQYWTHNPGAVDAAGDSLAFVLLPQYIYVSYTGAPALPVIGNMQPGDPILGPGSMRIDAQSGVLSWDMPQLPGAYAVAIQVYEYQQGGFRWWHWRRGCMPFGSAACRECTSL